MAKILRLSEIKERYSDLISAHIGGDLEIKRVAEVEHCGPGDLIFIDHKNYVKYAVEGKPSGIVLSEELLDTFSPEDDLGILVSKNVKLLHALIKQAHFDRNFLNEQWDNVNKNAVIHPSVKVPDSSFIGPGTVICRGVKIGQACQISPGVVIENGASIGDHCVIHPNVVVGYDCIIGNNVILGAGSVIGSEGFGFAQDRNRKSHRIPQTGIVVIEDNVRIGGNNVIDRATYGRTKIGAGTKTDNFVHIAHNVQVGEDCLLLAFFCVAGSTKIGNRVWTSGHIGILDHLNVCDDSVLVHRASVAQDITEPGMYAGLPLQPIKDHMRNCNHFKNLTGLNKKLRNLEKQVEALTKKV